MKNMNAGAVPTIAESVSPAWAAMDGNARPLLRRRIIVAAAAALLAACGSREKRVTGDGSGVRRNDLPPGEKGREVVLYALAMLDTGYRFGGKNPQAGFDCSGMVSYIYARAAGIKVSGSAADIARQGRTVDQLRPGDLVFFNTMQRPFSHVGIYIGDNRFVHAPSTNGQVRIDAMGSRYYAERFHAARAYFD